MMGNGSKPIMVVEKDAQMIEQFKDMLSQQYQLEFVDNTDLATRKLLKKGVYSAILLDAFDQDESGFDFLSEIEKDCYAHPPVIAVLKEFNSELTKQIIAAGAEEFILAPFESVVIINRLKNVIARSNIFNIDSNRYMLKYDSLTGIFNRHTMYMETSRLLHSYDEVKFCIVIIDIKRFSLYNSTFGEHEGDVLLCKVSDSVRDEFHDLDMCTYGRVGDDVFAVCLPYDKFFILNHIKKIRNDVASFREDYLIELAAGIYVVDNVRITIESMFYRAINASDKQKTEYMSDVTIYDKTMEENASNEQIVVNEMKHALDEGQFAVYLQPKFSLKTGVTYGAEALVRWIHPTRGILSPSMFIPVFEKNGFIANLDYYMWEGVCKIIRRWLDLGIKPTPISVNMSRISMYNPNVVELLANLVKKYDISASYVGIEITESAYMDNPQLMKNTLQKLKKEGFTVLMDDFGSGYSSLNTLKDFDVDVVKIDMQFLPKRDNKVKGQIILSAVIDMVDSLEIESIIEGVETEEQREYLRGIGCNMAQGYYFSRPIPVEEYEEKILNFT